MYEQEIKLNQFVMDSFSKVMADIPADRINERPAGNGHPPLWVLGHLAICVELGHLMLGTPIKTTEWMPVFGPGSSDTIENPEAYDAADLINKVKEGYAGLCTAAAGADAEALAAPNEIDLLEGSVLVTRGDLLSHLLTTHFAFHVAQLSAWRRAAGHAPLF